MFSLHLVFLQGIVQRYQLHGMAEPVALYVDRDCCSLSGKPQILSLFEPWTCDVRLDAFHFIKRLAAGLITDAHILHASFMGQLSECVFAWDLEDINRLTDAKRAELRLKGLDPTNEYVVISCTK